jgi:hypothetical protein
MGWRTMSKYITQKQFEGGCFAFTAKLLKFSECSQNSERGIGHKYINGLHPDYGTYSQLNLEHIEQPLDAMLGVWYLMYYHPKARAWTRPWLLKYSDWYSAYRLVSRKNMITSAIQWSKGAKY